MYNQYTLGFLCVSFKDVGNPSQLLAVIVTVVVFSFSFVPSQNQRFIIVPELEFNILKS